MRTVRALALGILLTPIFLTAAGLPLPAADPYDPDEDVLQRAKVRTRTSDLVKFLNERCGDDADLQRIETLVGQLGSKNFTEREQASRRLAALGWAAQDAVRRATHSDDPETARGARVCLEQIQQESNWVLPLAAVRLLVRRQEIEPVPALLRYLPYAADEDMVEEIWFGLDALTLRDRNVPPALRDGLKDTLPARRAAAACIVGRRGNAEKQAEVRKLLADAKPMVRLRAAQGLLGAKDNSGIPVLIALLSEPAVEVSWQAEELLHWAAGLQAPPVTVGGADSHARSNCRSAWEVWWREQGTQLDLDRVYREPRRPGLVLAGDRGENGDGSVILFGCDGKTRWRMTGLGIPKDVRFLGQNRLLIGEWAGQGATVRDLNGRIRQQISRPGQHADICQRLPNGNWFLIDNDTILELDPELKEVRTQVLRDQAGTSFRGLQRLRSGEVIAYENNRRGEEFLTAFSMIGARVSQRKLEESLKALSFRLDTQFDGKYLLAGLDHDEVRVLGESAGFDRRVSLAGVQAAHAVGLRNGNILVAGRRSGTGVVAEVHPDGRFFRQAVAVDPTCVRPCLELVRLGFDDPYPASFDLAAEVRRKVIEEKRRKEEPYLRALAEKLNDPDPERRVRAVVGLSDYGAVATPYLIRALKHRDAKVRAEVVISLGSIHSEARSTVPVLVIALKDSDPLVRYHAADSLRQLAGVGRPEVKMAVPGLIEALNDTAVAEGYSKATVAQMAAYALWFIGADARDAVRSLVEALTRNPDNRVRTFAAMTLGRIGPSDEAVVPSLISALKDPEVRSGAAEGLAHIGSRALVVVPALIEAARIQDVRDAERAVNMRIGVIRALGKFGAEAKAAVPFLAEIIRDRALAPALRQVAAETLGNIGPAAINVLPILTEAAEDRDRRVSAAAARALTKIDR